MTESLWSSLSGLALVSRASKGHWGHSESKPTSGSFLGHEKATLL